MRKFHDMEYNDLISLIVHANDINHNMFIWSYLHICYRTCEWLILRNEGNPVTGPVVAQRGVEV